MHGATSPYNPRGPGGPRPWTPIEIIGVAWKRTLNSFAPLVIAQLVVGALIGLPALLPALMIALRTWAPAGIEVTIYNAVFQVVALFAGAFFGGGLYALYLSAARQAPGTVGTVFAGGRTFVRLLQLHALFAIPGFLKAALDVLAVLTDVSELRTVGLVMVVLGYIPVLVFALRWALAVPLMVDRDLSLGEATRESVRLLDGRKGDLFLYFLAVGFVVVLSACACILPVFVTAPMVYVGLAIIYLRCSGDSEGGPEDGGAGYGPPGNYPNPQGHMLAQGGSPYGAGPGGGYGMPPQG
jgi:Membrane domain of glycerophosphoryl diester phosphodiesterase